MGLFSSILSGMGGLVGDIIGDQANKSAVKKAGKAEIEFLQKGIDEQGREYDLSRADQKPYMDFGTTALPQLGDLLGLNGPDAASTAIAALKQSPIFTSLFNTGQEATLQNASATGGLRGGNTEGALYDLGSNTLSQVLQNQIQNLFGAAGVGQGSTTTVDALGANKANAVTNLLSGMGQVKAGTILGKQQVDNNLSNQISSMISSIMSGGMGGGMSMGMGG